MKKIAVLTSGWSVDFVLSVIEGMEKVCKAHDISLYVFTCYKFIEPSGEENITSFAVFDLIKFEEYDGIVFMPGLLNDDNLAEKYAEKIRESKVPAVSIGTKLPGFKYVCSDNYEATKNLFLHLIKDHGVKTIGFVDGPADNIDIIRNRDVHNKMIAEGNLTLEEVELFHVYTDWTYNSAYKLVNEYFDNNDKIPDAIVGVNHLCAMAALKAAAEHGYSVPENIKIVSFDDCPMNTKVMPSLTAISVNEQSIGEAAIESLLNPETTGEDWRIQASYIKRQSCGCKRNVTKEQMTYSQGFVKELDMEQRFSSQLRFLEDRFLRSKTVPELCDDLQQYFLKRHYFEGPDFALCIDKDVMNNITETLTDSNNHVSYTDKMQTIVNLENGVPVSQYTFNTSDLLPPNMQSEKSATYLIFSIFIQKYIYGYYVSKDFKGLLLSKAAYNWTRNVGSSIEKYRQTSVYRRMSEQLQILSTQDALSGLLNRAGLYSYATDLFMKNNSNNDPTEVIFVDINDMKHINDRFGHLQGDLAIKTVAEAISTSVPKDYISVRYGGDEFVIIGTPFDNTDYAEVISQQLQEKVIQMALPYKLTASIGSKIFQPGEKEILSLAISEVDKIMYQKKTAYHNSNN